MRIDACGIGAALLKSVGRSLTELKRYRFTAGTASTRSEAGTQGAFRPREPLSIEGEQRRRYFRRACISDTTSLYVFSRRSHGMKFSSSFADTPANLFRSLTILTE